MKFVDYMQLHQQRVNKALTALLPPETLAPTDLHQAMHYTIAAGGKRVRALLVYATGQAFAADLQVLDTVAAAVEFVHAYSLIHDDLPAMDDDDLRRGQPSCHKAFNEAVAILAGDALQSLAFAVLANISDTLLPAEYRAKMVYILAQAIGSQGMAGGQAYDLAAEGQSTIDYSQLIKIHNYKTGALIAASVCLGALAGRCDDQQKLDDLDQFAKNIGLAFQIRDDILDIESTTEMLGKQQGADLALQKATYPALLGLDESKRQAQALYEQAFDILDNIAGDFTHLKSLAGFIINREQ